MIGNPEFNFGVGMRAGICTLHALYQFGWSYRSVAILAVGAPPASVYLFHHRIPIQLTVHLDGDRANPDPSYRAGGDLLPRLARVQSRSIGPGSPSRPQPHGLYNRCRNGWL